MTEIPKPYEYRIKFDYPKDYIWDLESSGKKFHKKNDVSNRNKGQKSPQKFRKFSLSQNS